MDDDEVLFSLCMLTIMAIRRVIATREEYVRSLALLQRGRRRRRRIVFSQRKRQQQLKMAFLQLQEMEERQGRRLWVLPRRKHWFETEVLLMWDENRWLENFRMSKESFRKLCHMLRHKMEPSMYAVREPIPLETRIAMALYNLGSNMEYRVTANQFGSHKSTVRKHLIAFCQAVTKEMAEYITIPSTEEAKEIARRWQAKWGFPMTYGAIDGTHIPISAPEDGYRDHVNRKGWPSIQLQAVCDDRYLFRSINCGGRGSWHDSTVLQTSHLYNNSHRLPQATVVLEGVPVNLCIVGDPAYPLTSWLMKPYPQPLKSNRGRQLTRIQEHVAAKEESFNVYLSSGRMVIECAFGRLKGRWRKLQKRMDTHHAVVPLIITACCILHNFCEMQGDRFNDAWVPEGTVELEFPQPCSRAHAGNYETGARDMRDAIRNYLAKHYPLRKSSFC